MRTCHRSIAGSLLVLHRSSSRQADPGLARQSHRRGRGRARRWHPRARRGAQRRLDRCVRGGRAPGWRRRVRRQGSRQGGPGGDRRDPARPARLRRRRPAADRPGPDRSRRDAGQVAARRERDSRGQPRGGPGRRGVGAAAAVPLPWRAERPRPAGPADEHPQRRRARGQQPRRPGVHDPPDRRGHLRRCAALGRETYHALKSVLKQHGLATGVGDEGGFAPDLEHNRAALDLIIEAIGKAGLTPGEDVALGLDVAASEFYSDGAYNFERSQKTAAEMTGIYAGWLDAYPIVSIEDPLAEEDWPGWSELTARLGGRVQVVGDDIFVTNPE